MTLKMKQIGFTILSFLLIFYTNSLFSEKKSAIKYRKNLQKVLDYKANLSKEEKIYYEPRKRYIDKQSVSPKMDYFYQINIIQRGALLRKQHRWNQKQILKLEKFLETADDFQLHRYFSNNEDAFLSMRAKDAIQIIKEDAARDEEWRKKNDPVFADYLKDRATEKEKAFYEKNKALFFRPESGEKLIQTLQLLAF